MILNKITKLGVAAAVLGLGILAACTSEDNVASSFSETNTGKPVELGLIAQLDTSLVQKKHVKFYDACDEVYENLDGTIALAKSGTLGDSSEYPVIKGDWEFLGDVFYCRSACGGSAEDFYFYINARVQIVDTKGDPVKGAKAYVGDCAYDNKDCQYTSDKDGYIYLNNVNYLSYFENQCGEKSYAHAFAKLQMRVLSADSNFGNNVYAKFSKAKAVEVDGEIIADLEKIVLEPVYTAKVYLDSLHRLSGNFGICLKLEKGSSPLYEKEDRPYNFSPCQIVTDEDQQNRYVILYGLPEGTYEISLGEPGAWYAGGLFPSVVVKKK